MDQQNGTQSSTKRRRSRQTNKQNGIQAPALPPPANDDKEAWKTYWEKQGQYWRTEPEIDTERQAYLAERRTVTPDINKGIYPFKDIKLTRADVEWLLSTLESGRGPVNPDDALRWGRKGIDIRGADLRGVDLRNLPLAGVLGSLTWAVRNAATEEEREMAAVHMEGAKLNRAHLERARLHEAHLENADLEWAYMEEANLRGAHLDGTRLHFSYLQGAFFRDASMKGADLTGAFLERARFANVVLSDEKGTGPFLADAHWENINLALVKWPQKNMLGEEHKARQKMQDEKLKDKAVRLDEYERAVRANRQLSVALQSQGLNEIAARFAYRAQLLQKRVLWFQMTQPKVTLRQRMQKLGALLFSWFLFLLAGYGYRPGRSILAYLIIIFGFMGLYLLNAHFVTPHLKWDEALVISVSSFHGRGFFSQNITLGDMYARLAAVEAVAGLLIEISFIATFTQRFFGK